MNVLTFIILTWSFSYRYSLPWPLLPASLGLIALGMLIFERKRLELYGDVVVGPGGVRLRWAEVSQFTSLFGTRPWGQSHLPEIGALLSNGSTITVAAPYGVPHDGRRHPRPVPPPLPIRADGPQPWVEGRVAWCPRSLAIDFAVGGIRASDSLGVAM